MKLRHRTRHDESGFTLAELILAIAIETIIFGALATAFVVVLNGGTSVNENLGKSNDARFAANYMISDARNSSGPEISLTDTAACPDANPPVAGPQTAVAVFNWDATDATGTDIPNIANYVLVSGSLMRRHCEGGVLMSDSVLANDVDTVDVSCAPIADCTVGNPVSITVTITETADKAGGTPFSYSLTAAFRKLVASGGSITPTPPKSLVLFGSGGCAIDVSGGSTIGLKVYGQAFINAVDSGSCKAINLSGSGKFTAGSTSILTGGSCVASGGSSCPTWSSFSPAATDPYAGLTAPATTGIARTNPCGGTSGSFTAQPGIYASPFVVQGAVHCTLATGIYVFKAGFSVTASGTIDTAPGGVLLYLTGGQFNIDGAGFVTLAAMTTGIYSGLVVWQAAADTTTFNLAAGGVVAFSGVIYAKTATVFISGDAQGTKATSIVAKNIIMNGSAGMIIGASLVPLSVSGPASLPASTVGRAYPSTTLTASGGDGSYTWSQTGLPTGMALNANTGVISGTPTVAGTATVTITLNDALGDVPDTQGYSLQINALPVITTVTPLPVGEKTAPYAAAIATTGGTAPFVWTGSPLPAGVTFSTSTGVFGGTPTTAGSTTVTVGITDASGATVSKSGLVLVIGTNPTVAVTLTNVASGGTAGRLDKGDKIQITFSAAMKLSTICSTWADGVNAPAFVPDTAPTVTLNDGTSPTHDTITVASTTCTFNFTLLDLISSAFVSGGNAVFGGTGANATTISYTASTRVMLITLGAKTGPGTVATVGAVAPIYTAGGIRSLLGGTLSNSPLTLASGVKF